MDRPQLESLPGLEAVSEDVIQKVLVQDLNDRMKVSLSSKDYASIKPWIEMPTTLFNNQQGLILHKPQHSQPQIHHLLTPHDDITDLKKGNVIKNWDQEVLYSCLTIAERKICTAAICCENCKENFKEMIDHQFIRRKYKEQCGSKLKTLVGYEETDDKQSILKKIYCFHKQDRELLLKIINHPCTCIDYEGSSFIDYSNSIPQLHDVEWQTPHQRVFQSDNVGFDSTTYQYYSINNRNVVSNEEIEERFQEQLLKLYTNVFSPLRKKLRASVFEIIKERSKIEKKEKKQIENVKGKLKYFFGKFKFHLTSQDKKHLSNIPN